MLNALIVCRFLHFAATMLLFGASAFVWALAPADELADRLSGPIKSMNALAIVVAAATALAWLGLEAGQMGEGWSDSLNLQVLCDVLNDTAFGRVWLWRIGLAFVLLCILALRQHGRWWLVAATAALLLASLGLVGHATMQSGTIGIVHRLNHCVHLLLAGAWLGGLAPFILCLRQGRDLRLRPDVGTALRRFSGIGHFVVALIVATGVVNTMLTLGGWPIDFSSPYQALLAAKIMIVASMIAIALFNRYVLTPRLKLNDDAALTALTVNSAVELALGTGVLALVSAFGLFAPV